VPTGFDISPPLGPRCRLGDITLVIPRDWCDTTEPKGPLTLSRPEGTGAFQLSTALYEAGQIPDFSAATLRELLLKSREHLGVPANLVTETAPPLAAATWLLDNGAFEVRFWYVSDGLNLAMATYTSAPPVDAHELADAELMVRSIKFLPTVTQ